jgi:hypothetical protein
MTTNVGDYFQLGTGASEDDGLFFNAVKNQPDTRYSLLELSELLMEALKLDNIRYRTGAFHNPPPKPHYIFPKIPTEKILDKILKYLPEDVKAPLQSVHFVHRQPFDTVPVTVGGLKVNAAYQFMPYASINQPAFGNDWLSISHVHYADRYNTLLADYAGKGWPSMPSSLSGYSSKTPPTGVKTALTDLAAWIRANDPRITAIATQSTALDVVPAPAPGAAVTSILNDANIDSVDFIAAFMSELNRARRTHLGSTNIGAASHFFECVKDTVNTVDSIWQTNDSLVKFSGPISTINSINQKISVLFYLTTAMFVEGISNTATNSAVVTGISTIFSEFANKVGPGTSNKPCAAFLIEKLKKALSTVQKTVDQNLRAIDEWAAAVEAVPTAIPSETIKQIFEVARDILGTIKLAPIPTGPISSKDLSDIRLFVFTDHATLGTQDGAKPASLTDDSLVVEGDARETTDPSFVGRPTFLWQEDSHKNPILKFYNIGSTTKGVWTAFPAAHYFLDVGSPNRVLTHRVAFGTVKENLQFDFRAATINGTSRLTSKISKWLKNSPSLAVNMSYRGGPPQRSPESLEVFTSVLKKITKWGNNLNGRWNYDILYQILPHAPSLTVHLMWRLPSGRSLNRAEQIDDILCLWEYCSGQDSHHPELGSLLELPPERMISGRSAANNVMINGTSWNIIKDQVRPVQNIYCRVIEISRPGEPEPEAYVQTNTIHPSLGAELNNLLNRSGLDAHAEADTKSVLSNFDIAYYRRIDSALSAAPKIIKRIQNPDSPVRPGPGDGTKIVLPQDPGGTYIGIDLPISFRLNENVREFKRYTSVGPDKRRPTLKNKGKVLYRSAGPRQDAGRVMRALTDYLVNPSNLPGTSTLPATGFANWVIAVRPPAKSNGALTEWQALKGNGSSTLPVNQEWCHLQGHGDGGDERLGNFVSGSYHCNTEQLAIEVGQRQVTHLNDNSYQLRTTAYLFPNTPSLLDKDYLQSDQAYKSMRATYPGHIKRGPNVSDTGKTAPLAALIRYKVHRIGGSPPPQKKFEHLFEGQSEFTDRHQYTILRLAAEFALSGEGAFKVWYESQTEGVSKASKRARPEG